VFATREHLAGAFGAVGLDSVLLQLNKKKDILFNIIVKISN